MDKLTAEEGTLADGSDNNVNKNVNASAGRAGFLSRMGYFLWHFHKKLVISVIVLSALILSGLRGAALYIESHPEKVEALLERSAGLKTRFNKIDVEISPLFPALYLQDVAIIDESGTEALLKLGQAKIEINVWRSLIQGQPIIKAFKLQGISAIIRRDPEGRFFMGDLSLSERQAGQSDELNFSKGFLFFLAQPEIQIAQSEFYIVDQLNEIPTMLFNDINIKLQNQHNRHQITAEVTLNNTDTRVDFRLDFNGKMQQIKKWDGTIFAQVESLKDETVLPLLGEDVLQVENFKLTDFNLNTQVWAKISQGSLHNIRGEFRFRDVNLFRAHEDDVLLIDELSTDIKIERGLANEQEPAQSDDWNVDLNNIQCEIGAKELSLSRINLQYSAANECTECELMPAAERVNPQLQIYIDSLDFSKTAPLVHFFSPVEFHEQLYRVIKPRGQMKDSYAVLSLESLDMPINIVDYQLQTSLQQVGLNAINLIPEVRNFSAEVQINPQSGVMDIDSHEMKLHISSLFRDGWPISDLSGAFAWQKDGTDWLLQGSHMAVANKHLKGTADVKLWIPEAGSKRDIFMDLSAYYQDADIAYTSEYLPLEIMKDGLVQWLDNAIVSGTGTDGGALFRGRLGHFPFDDYSGHMDIVFNTEQAVLEYMKDWPQLENIQARLQFTGQGMWAESNHVETLGAVGSKVNVDIERFKKPVLQVSGEIAGKVKDGREFLKQSQLLSAAMMGAIDGQGDIGINLNLSKPLKQQGADTQVKVRLKDVQYFPPGLAKKQGLVDKLNGEVIVHNNAISSNKLQARIMGRPAQAEISTRSLGASRVQGINISVDTSTSVQQLSEYEILPQWLNPLLTQVSGHTAASLDINVPYQKYDASVTIHSDLKGISSKLPHPLNKNASELKNSKVTLVLQKQNQEKLTLNYAEQIAAALLIDTNSEPAELLKAQIHFGQGQAALPAEPQLLLTGSIEEINFDAWGRLLASEGDTPAGNKTEESNKRLKTADAPRKFPLPVQLSLSKLVLPELFKDESAIEVKADTQAQAPVQEQSFIDPGDFPTINGSIKQLYMADALLGQAEIKSVRLKNSIHFKQLALTGSLLDFKGNAIWNQWKGEPKFDMQGQLHIPSLENALKTFGFTDFVQGTEARLSGGFGWPGGPLDFNREKVNGQINIDLRDGRLLSSKKGGAGRLLGILNLLNMNEIFRRITLDFSDVSRRGLEFNSITGDFSLSGGDALTQNYVLIAPSLILANSGRLGLLKRDIDMSIMAIPDVSGTLPIAGAAVAGPAGAAVVWIGQKILGDKINRITALQYKASGSWDNPKIEKQPLTENALKSIKKISGYDKLIEVRDGFLENDESVPDQQKQAQK